MRQLTKAALVLLALISWSNNACSAGTTTSNSPLSKSNVFSEQTGEALYAGICQGCHMADAKGATGAGRYPALAANPNLEIAGYPISILVRGQNAMPAIGRQLTDAQVAAVVNYIRTHFGNAYTDRVKSEDVAAARK
jgi:mono/diheme cytochrome c family protein